MDGVRLMGPQGSNDFGVPNASSAPEISALWDDLGLPREFTYSSLAATRKQLPVSITTFDHQIWSDTFRESRLLVRRAETLGDEPLGP